MTLVPMPEGWLESLGFVLEQPGPGYAAYVVVPEAASNTVGATALTPEDTALATAIERSKP